MTVGLLQIIRVLFAVCCHLFLCHLLYSLFITCITGSVLRTSGNQRSGVYSRKSDARGTFIITHETFSAHLVGEDQLHLGCNPQGYAIYIFAVLLFGTTVYRSPDEINNKKTF